MEESLLHGMRLGSGSPPGVGRRDQVGEIPGTTSRLSRLSTSTRKNLTTNDPCWFLENVSLKTGTEIVALFGIFTHPAMLLTSFHFWLFGTSLPIRTGALALCCANAILIPANYILLIAAKHDNHWLCLFWISVSVIFALVDFGIVIGFYNSIYFVVFQIIVFTTTVYKLWVVVLFYASLKAAKLKKEESKVTSHVTFEPSEFTMDSSRVVVIESEMVVH